MVPFYDSQSPMDMPLFQQLQLTPPSPKPDHQSFFHYPSPSFAAAEGFHLGYLGTDIPQLLPPMPQTDQPPPLPPPMPKADSYNVQQGSVAGGRAVRKDRHSKICTAGGMRDRRMRLSLDVARRFFALQDMLGFDKASKTVQWLLNMSKAAIRELMSDAPSSGCEEDGSSTLSDGKQKPAEAAEGGKTGRNEGKRKNGARKANTNPKPKPQRRVLANYAHPVPDKESRAKARERARERTREKNLLRWATLASTINVESRPINLNYSSSMSNEGRIQEISMASKSSDEILAFDNAGAAAYNNGYCSQEQWELGEVVFANSQFY